MPRIHADTRTTAQLILGLLDVAVVIVARVPEARDCPDAIPCFVEEGVEGRRGRQCQLRDIDELQRQQEADVVSRFHSAVALLVCAHRLPIVTVIGWAQVEGSPSRILVDEVTVYPQALSLHDFDPSWRSMRIRGVY